MRSIIFTFIQLLIVTALFGQIHFSDDFSNVNVPYYPPNWTVDGSTDNWRTNNTNEAGGEFPEAYFYSNPLFNGYSRLISPEINLSGQQIVMLSFKHKVVNYLGGYTIGVATRSQEGDWNEVWSVEVTGDIPAETVSITINNDDVGQSDFQFCMFFSGSSANAYKWFLDDVILYSLYNIDAYLVSTEVTDILTKGDIFQINGAMKNSGQTTITDFIINWQMDDGEIVSDEVSGLNIPNGGTYAFTSSSYFYVPDELGTYNFKVWLSDINGLDDEYPENNIIERTLEVANNAVRLIPLFEEFTSSTCTPCANFNANILGPLLEANPDKYTLIKYQMNWPGTGDPYYTAEGGVRKNFYGFSGVPNLYLDGDDFEQSIYQDEFDVYYDMSSKMDIAVSHHLTGSEMNVQAAVIPYSDFSELTVHIVVVEKITTGNVGTNGETEFHNVMMKMMPDAYGTTTSFTYNTPFIIYEAADMSQTFVEELDDLEVVVFVQENSTKTIYQSALSVESENLLLPPMSLQAETVNKNINLYWTAPASTSLTGYNIYRNGEQINSSIISETEYSDQNMENGVYKYTITAVYSDAESIHSNSATIEMSYYTGISNKKMEGTTIFPNPAEDHFIIKSLSDFNSVVIYDLAGQIVYQRDISSSSSLQIDSQPFNTGVYLVKLISLQNQQILKLIIK